MIILFKELNFYFSKNLEILFLGLDKLITYKTIFSFREEQIYIGQFWIYHDLTFHGFLNQANLAFDLP